MKFAVSDDDTVKNWVWQVRSKIFSSFRTFCKHCIINYVTCGEETERHKSFLSARIRLSENNIVCFEWLPNLITDSFHIALVLFVFFFSRFPNQIVKILRIQHLHDDAL